MQLNDITRFEEQDEETAGQDIVRFIRQEPGKLKQTNINICGYEMHQMELLDRTLIAIQNTEDAFIDINNRIISNVNQRKERLNNLNGRIANLAKRTLALYNCQDPMRVESPAKFPKISTYKCTQMHPHQSIFYDPQKVIDEEIKNNPTFQKNEEFGLPELYSMQFNKKIFNTRLVNYSENLGNLVKGITKDINEVSALIIDSQKYGTQIHNIAKDLNHEMQLKKQQNIKQSKLAQNQEKRPTAVIPANDNTFESEGILGRMPDDVESIAELMLQDSDVMVYQESKVVLKEEAFTIRGKKQKTQAQKNQIIRDRQIQAKAHYDRLLQKQQEQFIQDAQNILFKPSNQQVMYSVRNQDNMNYKPAYKPAPALNLPGISNTGVDFDLYNQKNQQRKQQKINEQSQVLQGLSMDNGQQNNQQQIEENGANEMNNDESSDLRQSDLETIAPAKGVAQLQEQYKKKQEEIEKARQEQLEKLKRDEESGVHESNTNLPIDFLIRKKIEEQIKGKMNQAQEKISQGDGQPGISLATTMQTSSTQITNTQKVNQPHNSGNLAASQIQVNQAKQQQQQQPQASASNIPIAPPVSQYYEFLGGGKSKPVETGDDLTKLLGEADDDLEFKPDDIQFNSSKLDISEFNVKEQSQAMPGESGFKELSNADLSKMPLAEQLSYQRKLNEWKSQQGTKKPEEVKIDKPGQFKELSNAEVAKMPLAEQLVYQKKLNEWKNEQKQPASEQKEQKNQDFKELTPQELAGLPLADQLQYQKKLNEHKNAKAQAVEEKKETQTGFKELTPNELAGLPLADQLSYQKKFNEWKNEQNSKQSAATNDKKESNEFKELTPAQLAGLPLADQLTYQKKFNEYKNEQKQKAAPAEEKKQQEAGFKELSPTEVAQLTMAQQLAYQKKYNEWKNEQKKLLEATQTPAQEPETFKELSNQEVAKMPLAQQLGYQKRLNEWKSLQQKITDSNKNQQNKSQLDKSQMQANNMNKQLSSIIEDEDEMRKTEIDQMLVKQQKGEFSKELSQSQMIVPQLGKIEPKNIPLRKIETIRGQNQKDIKDLRRISNIDQLKNQINLRFNTIRNNPANQGKKKADDSDENEDSSSDNNSDSN